MGLEIRRRIRDNLYGSVDISSLEDEVIAHPFFQRLRRIRQTAFLNLVFPGASHSRFEHSLGVMHLAGMAWSKIKDNQLRIRAVCGKYRNFSERERQRLPSEPLEGYLSPSFSVMDRLFSSSYVLQTLRLAALLHDVGHPPFSHSGERFLPDGATVLSSNPQIPPYLATYLSSRSVTHQKRVSHEVFTVLIVDQILSDIYLRKPDLALKVVAQDLASLIIPQIPPAPGSELAACGAQSLCHELISGEMDIDRMDYLRRDARECGVAYGIFDSDRILDSLAAYANVEDGRIHLALQYSGLPAFEDYLRARQSMYLQLYFHKTSTACEAMMQRLADQLKHWHIPANVMDYCQIDEYEIRSVFLKAGRETLPPSEQPNFSALVHDLLVNRRLWKMIYEISADSKRHDSMREELQTVLTGLHQVSITTELVSSHNVLSKFRNRKTGQRSENYLRLIKKDGRQFPRVEAIEDYSSIIQETGVVFHRIYVRRDDAGQAERVLREALDA